MILILILLFIIIWVFITITRKRRNNNDILHRLVSYEKKILSKAQIKQYNYSIVEDKRTYIVFERSKESEEITTIHICLTDSNTGKQYSEQTILIAFIHELSHMICLEHGHTKKFYKIEDLLIDTAIDIGIINKEYEIDDTYPCL